MKIKLSEIVNEKEFTYENGEFEDFEVVYPAKITGRIQKIGNRYQVIGSYEVTVKLECVRCLKEIFPKLKGSFEAVYLDVKDYKSYLEGLGEIEEFDNISFEEAKNNEIDMNSLVREHILLELLQNDRCNPECESIEDIEKYSKDEMDPRWHQLLEIEI